MMDLNPEPSTGHPGALNYRHTSQAWICCVIRRKDEDFSPADSSDRGGTQKEMSDDNQDLPPSLLSKHTQETHRRRHVHTRTRTH